MPYTAYAKVSDEDLQDLFAYLQLGLAPAHEARRPSAIPWPFSIRWPLALWNLAFHDHFRFAVDGSKDEQWNRGAYLVQGLAHCGTCHTPRGMAFEEVDVSGRSNLYLSGSEFDGTSPINLRGNIGDGLGRWSASDIAEILKSGRNPHSTVTGTMADVVRDSTQYMIDQDVAAIATYLKSLSPAPEDRRATFAASDATIRTINRPCKLRNGSASTTRASGSTRPCASLQGGALHPMRAALRVPAASGDRRRRPGALALSPCQGGQFRGAAAWQSGCSAR